MDEWAGEGVVEETRVGSKTLTQGTSVREWGHLPRPAANSCPLVLPLTAHEHNHSVVSALLLTQSLHTLPPPLRLDLM